MTRALALSVSLFSGVALATTLVALDVEGLTQAADAVVHGTVRSVTSRWDGSHTRIVTETTIEVRQAWKGAPATVVTVVQPGGVVGDVGQHVEGIASFTPTEEVVLFLEARGPRFTVTGLAQGRFKVDRSSDGAAAYGHQDQVGEALLIDPHTRAPVSRPGVVLDLAALERRVRAEVARHGAAK